MTAESIGSMARNVEGYFTAILGLPQFFLKEYHLFQFGGWNYRNTEAGRVEGEIASHLTHPDVNKKFEELNENTQKLVKFISLFHLVLFLSLKQEDLIRLRDSGTPDKEIPADLLKLVNNQHHRVWLAARALFVLFGYGDVGHHATAKELTHLTEEQVAADDKQVMAYAKILNALPDDLFNALMSAART